jgi:hypothetical protein
MPRRKKRFVMIDSTDLAEQTAGFDAEEFRALIMLQCWVNENGLDSEGCVSIAISRLTSIAPNRRNSATISERRIRSMCQKMAEAGMFLESNGARMVREQGANGAPTGREQCANRAPMVRERYTKLLLRVGKPEQIQASEVPNKKKEYNKKKEQRREENAREETPPASAAGSSRSASRRKSRSVPFPDPFPPEDLERLALWSAGKAREFGAIDLDWALETVREWAAGKGELKADWVAAIQGYIRKGWARRPAEQASTQENPHARNAESILGRIASAQAPVPGRDVLDLPQGQHRRVGG